MRTFERTIFALVLGAIPVAAPGFAIRRRPGQSAGCGAAGGLGQPGAAAAMKRTAIPAPGATADASTTSLTSLQYAAEGGHPVAQWKLGRMYADGDGVTQDDLRAFEYFSRIANAHAEDSPSAPQAAIIANAFVALGRYYLERHSEFEDQAGHRAGPGDVLLCRVLFRQCRRPVRSGAALPEDAGRLAGGFPLWRALAGPRRPEGPAPGAGAARPDAVQRRPAAAAARPWPDVADAWRATAPRRTRSGSRKATIGRSRKRPTTTAPWRCRCSSTGCRAAGIDFGWLPRCRERLSGRLEIEIRPDRDMVGWLLPGPDVAVDADIDQPVAGLRRQQEMVDPKAPILLPGAGLVVPEGVVPGASVTARSASVRPRPSSDWKASRVVGRNRASSAQAAGL